MRREIIVKGKGLAGSSDLTLLASIKPGFVAALDVVTYKSRVKRLLKALHSGRSSAHEYALVRPLSDAVERVGRIHSVRVLVVEPGDKILLSATFDGSWEAYFRVLWQKTGRLLDAIYCNTVDYVTAWDHSYEEWLTWARRVQLETDFFYSLPSMTVDDRRYLRDVERHARRVVAPVADLDGTRYSVRSAEAIAKAVVDKGTEDPNLDGLEAATGLPQRELVKQSVQALAGLYSLTDLYVPGTPDGPFLQRAAVEFLAELTPEFDSDLNDDMVLRRFERQVRWLEEARKEPVPAVRVPPALPHTSPPPFDRSDVQGGIVEPYAATMTHGCLLLLAFDSVADASAFLARVLAPNSKTKITTAAPDDDPALPKRNIAFTLEGLRQCGLDESQLSMFPDEFRHGMAARAGQIGDLRTNHPRRWPRPRRYGALPTSDERIELSAVHAVVQLRIVAKITDAASDFDVANPNHPLHPELSWLAPAHSGTRILAVESMRRQFRNEIVVEHFGFADGASDATINPSAPDRRVNQVQLGEILLGYDNEADRPSDPATDPKRSALFVNGSYLVVRKLRQFVDRFEAAVDRFEATVDLTATPTLDREMVYGKLMGRRQDGTPMVDAPPGSNNFTFDSDPEGRQCPLHAHIRRAHPRVVTADVLPGRRRPHIARRSMSYGRSYDRDNPHAARNSSERGLVFMAYNTSIGEQFEVVQRWLAGGNSTGSSSNQSDPLIGVPENGRQRWFRFENDKEQVMRMALDGSDCLFDAPRPFVQLEWGAYFFAPSITALGLLRDTASTYDRPSPAWDADQGERTVQQLLTLGMSDPERAAAEWKRVLEDVEAVRTFVAAAVWAAIRARHGGLLRTPYGVLVADGDLVGQILGDKQGYSVRGYLDRMQQSIGVDHLGLDDTGPGCPYREQSGAVNDAIEGIPRDEAFDSARRSVRTKLKRMIDDAKSKSNDFRDPRFEVSFDPREIIEEVLADLCESWFGLEAASGHFKRGGLRWDWQSDEPPLYPGHFGAPSRFIFQPRPGTETVHFGIAHGMAVRTAMRRFVEDYRTQGRRPTAPDGNPATIGEAAFGPVAAPVEPDLAGRTLAGAIMGMVPTMEGALRRVLSEWTSDGTFWTLRARRGGVPFSDRTEALEIEAPLKRALQLRPMPELVWRVASSPQILRGSDGQLIDVQSGDVVVLSLVSTLQQDLVDAASDDIYMMFGGDRSRTPHPTHACPGYGAGMAAMLGTLAALVEYPESMRPGAAAPTIVIEGASGLSSPPETCVAPVSLTSSPASASTTPISTPLAAIAAAQIMKTKKTLSSPASVSVAKGEAVASAPTRGVLLAWGDSWLCYRSPGLFGQQSNLMKRLLDAGFKSAPQSPYAQAGTLLSTMAGRPPDDQVYTLLDDMLALGQPPQAVLLSASGNDCVKNALLRYVRDKASGTTLDAPAWKAHLGVLRSYFAVILAKIKAISELHQPGKPIPVLLHGYDHPIADGRYLFGGAGGSTAWIHGWLVTKLRYTVAEATGIMEQLIDELNDTMSTLTSDAALGRVIHVKTAGVLRQRFGADMSDAEWFDTGYKQAWENELHPKPDGFRALADKITAELDAL